MLHVFKNLLGRQLPTIVLAVLFITIMESMGQSFGFMGVLLILGSLLLVSPGEASAAKILRTLPISPRAVGSAYWILAVLPFPIFYCFWSPFTDALIIGNGGVPRFGEEMQVRPRLLIAIIGMGYSSLLFLLATPWGLASANANFRAHARSAVWLCFFLPCFFLQEVLVLGYQEQAQWFYLALLASPIAMGAVYYVAPSSMRNVPQRTKAQPVKTKAIASRNAYSNLNFWARIAAESLIVVSVFFGFTMLLSARHEDLPYEDIVKGFGMPLVIVGACFFRSPIRALRMLPLSSLRMAFLIAAINTIALIAASIVLGVALVITSRLDLVWLVSVQLLNGLAFRLYTIPLLLRFGIGGFLLAILVSLIPAMLLVYTDSDTSIRLVIALMSVLAAILLTKLFLDNSSEIYRTPKLNV